MLPLEIKDATFHLCRLVTSPIGVRRLISMLFSPI